MPQNLKQSDLPEDDRDDAVIGIALRYSLAVISLIGTTLGLTIGYRVWRNSPLETVAPSPVTLPTLRSATPRIMPQIPWTDVTQEAGIDFVHRNGATGEKLLPETMGGGCAFFDYNNDGFPDILLVDSKPWNHDEPATGQGRGGKQKSTLVLYENDGTGQFRDVTSEVGLDTVTYGQGCAIGDFDNDGFPDLFITGVWEPPVAGDGVPSQLAPSPGSSTDHTASAGRGPNRLFRNRGTHFEDITESAGVGGEPGDWGTSCGWFDFDNDGKLDLWVCNYVQWSREFDLGQNFRLAGGTRAYGRPQAFGGSFPRLYRNEGDGRFTEVSESAGIRLVSPTTGNPLAKSLGVVFHDFDRDGFVDVMVANDTVQNQLFRNLGNGTFREMATLSGVAFDTEGNARGAMGIDVGGAREDPRCACVVIGNFANEMTAYYVSEPQSFVFSDQAVANGLGPNTRLVLTFAVLFLDADLDGWDDILQANGHLEDDIAKVQASQTYEQSPQLFWNAGPESATEFIPLGTDSTGTSFSEPMVGRGAAYADIDGDGDLDVLITAVGGRPRLLRNDQQTENAWLRIRLVGNGTSSNRDAIGARVDAEFLSGRRVSKHVSPTRGYLSQSELPITLGLGTDELRSLQVQWPDGSSESIPIPPPNQMIEVVQKASR